MRLVIVLLILAVVSLIMGWYNCRPKLLVVGDSLSEPYKLPKKDGWVQKIERKLGKGWKVYNDSKSGRMAEEYTPKPGKYDIVIIELGANDIFWKGADCIPDLKKKLTELVRFYQKNDAQVLLTGIIVGPPHVGGNDIFKIKDMYREISNECDVKLVPFILANVGDNFIDGYHPNKIGHDIVTENVWSYLRNMT